MTREPPRQRMPLPPVLRNEGSYRAALDRLRESVDDQGRTIWVEKGKRGGKPLIFYRYNSNGRLMKYTHKIFGYEVTPAEYTRFGEDTNIRMRYE